MKTIAFTLIGLSLLSTVSAETYDEKDNQRVGDWSIATFHLNGQLSHGMIQLVTPDGRLFRYIETMESSFIHTFNNDHLMQESQSPSNQWTVSFEGNVTRYKQNSPLSELWVSLDDTLTNGQDANLQISLSPGDYIVPELRAGSKILIDNGRIIDEYSLSGSSAALDAMFTAMGKYDPAYLDSVSKSSSSAPAPAMTTGAPPEPGFDDEVLYDVEMVGTSGNLGVKSMSMQGRFSHAVIDMMEYAIVVQPSGNQILFYSEEAMRISSQNNFQPFPVKLTFIGSGNTEFQLTAKDGGNELLNMQDAYYQAALPADADLSQLLPNSTDMILSVGNVMHTMPLGPNGPRAWQLVQQAFQVAGASLPGAAPSVSSNIRMNTGSTTPAPTSFPTPPAGQPAGATATAFPGAMANPPAERITINPATPSISWTVSVPANSTKAYVVAGNSGQQFNIAFTEPTGQGIINVDNASVQEGVANASRSVLSETKDYNLVLENSTGAALNYTVYLEVK